MVISNEGQLGKNKSKVYSKLPHSSEIHINYRFFDKVLIEYDIKLTPRK